MKCLFLEIKMECNHCKTSFSRKDSMKRHTCSSFGAPAKANLQCALCQVVFTRKDNLIRHVNNVHKDRLCEVCGEFGSCSCDSGVLAKKKLKLSTDQLPSVSCSKVIKPPTSVLRCDICRVDFTSALQYRGHLRSQQHYLNSETLLEDGVYLIKSSFKQRVASYKIVGPENADIPVFLEQVKTKSCSLIRSVLQKFSSIKVQFELFGQYLNFKEKSELKSFNTKYVIVTEDTDIESVFEQLSAIIKTKSEEFQEKDSGYALNSVSHLEINVNTHKPLAGSSYIALPPSIESKKACINIQNCDNACLLWAVTAALFPANNGNPNRVSSYPHYSTVLRFDNIDLPVKIKDVSKIEELNNISINIYSLTYCSETMKYEVVGPIYFSKNKKNRHVNLLIVEEGERSHYVLIKNLSRLISAQLSKHTGRIHLCDGCLNTFPSEAALQRHSEHDCDTIASVLPSTELKINKNGMMYPENVLQFTGFEKKIKVPFVVYADFESLLIPVQSCDPNPSSSFTNVTHVHAPNSFAYKIVCSFDANLNKFHSYTGVDCAKVFISSLIEEAKTIYHKYLKVVKPMTPLTAAEQEQYDNATICHICESPLLNSDDKVRDHCHLTSTFRGAAHSTCNINYRLQHFIPVYFHNLSGYDSHLFIKDLACEDEVIDVIPENKEKYISFTRSLYVDQYVDKNGHKKNIYCKLRFLDSFRFMASSLDKLAKNLTPQQFSHVSSHFPNPSHFKLVTRKGVFPYQYIDNLEKLHETSLPPKKSFFNSLTNCDITDEEFHHAHTVWDVFECKTLADYSDLYLKTDVLLLADIFENFRKVCYTTYGLDPANYFTSPGLSWDAMLKCTKIKLDLLTDIDMHHFIKKSIRGGISNCSLRYAKANNKYMREYDENDPTSYLVYWDANNLYGWAMSQYQPYGGFRWMSEQEIQKFNVLNVRDDSDIGYFLEVDVEYPAHLHDKHNDLPFLSENIPPPNAKIRNTKLIANLYNKSKYVVHYRNLKQCIRNGLKVQRIHRILSFQQSDWLKKYIDLNTNLRKQATNDFEKDFFKLMNNSVFGKTMENVDKRVDVKLVTHWDDRGKRRGARSMISKVNFKSISIFTENFVAIQLERLKVVYNKPIYVGFTVLELSKLLMYDFYYDYLKNTYRQKVQLCYMDTDSLILRIETDDIYNDMQYNLTKFDTSNFHPDNIFNIPLQNKAVLGLMKDENGGKIMSEFVGLRSKMYANKVEGKLTKKAKGIKKYVVKDELSLEDYKNSLFNKELLYRQQNLFRNIKHTIFSVIQNKLALSPYDDKRYICADGVHTLAWGHKDIKL